MLLTKCIVTPINQVLVYYKLNNVNGRILYVYICNLNIKSIIPMIYIIIQFIGRITPLKINWIQYSA